MLFDIFLRDLHRDGDGITYGHRVTKAQRLAKIDSTRARQLRTKQGRDQRRAPHAMSDNLMKHIAASILYIDMRGIYVARHHGEKLDILPAQRPHKARRITNVHLVERAILNHVHNNDPSISSTDSYP